MKHCCVSQCKSNEQDLKKSFYQFPLHEPDRLQRWLTNMGREDWTPSRHQYVCHEHFTASCFKTRQGVRYLEDDAVPTVFKAPEKRKGTDQSEKKSKRLRCNVNLLTPAADDNDTQAEDVTAELSGGDDAVEPLHDIRDAVDSLRTDLANPPTALHTFDNTGSAADLPSTLLQTAEEEEVVIPGLDRAGENTEVLQCPATAEGQEEDDLLSGITAAILAQHRALLGEDSTSAYDTADPRTALCVENVTPDAEELCAVVPSDHEAHQVIAYFETVPGDVLPCVAVPPPSMPPCAISPETVLSSALSAAPIPSTVPIVSKRTSPPLLSMDTTQEGEWEDDALEEEEEGSTEQQEGHPEEHCLLRMTAPWRTPTR